MKKTKEVFKARFTFFYKFWKKYICESHPSQKLSFMIFFFWQRQKYLEIDFLEDWKFNTFLFKYIFSTIAFYCMLLSITCQGQCLISFMILLLMAPYLLNLSTVQCYFTILLLIAPYLLNLSTVQCYFTNNNLRINKTDLPRDFWINRQKKYLCSLH